MECYHARTNPGLEDVLASEARTRLSGRRGWEGLTVEPRPADRTGWVALRTEAGVAPDPAVFHELRTTYEVVHVTAEAELPPGSMADGAAFCAAVAAVADRARLPDIPPEAAIAVRCRRVGDHPVGSPEVERAVGTVVVRRLGNPVRLKTPDVIVRADLDGGRMTIGAVVAGPELDRRYAWIYRPRVTLSTVVAAAVLYLLEDPRWGTYPPDGHAVLPPTPDGAILDPFCGSGTVALEAAAISGSPVFASDLSREAVAGTRANVAVNGFGGRVAVRQQDATRLAAAYQSCGITRVACNPPFGVRLGRRIDYHAFYRDLLAGAAAVVPPGGRLALLASRRRGRFNRVVRESPDWHLAAAHLIEIGGVYPAIFVLQRLNGKAAVETLPRPV